MVVSILTILRRLRPSERTFASCTPPGKGKSPSKPFGKVISSSWLVSQVQVTIGRHHSRIRGLEIEHAISTLPFIPHFAIRNSALILPNWLVRGNKVEKACWGEKRSLEVENFQDSQHPVEIAYCFHSNFQPTPQVEFSF